jgi:hypothetical protein
LQAKSPQLEVAGVEHAPVPSQPAWLVCIPVASEQAPETQIVGAAGYVHAILFPALQMPPQVIPALTHAGRGAEGCPCVTAEHLPNPGSANLQYSQAPLQAESQQTPSAQWPETHWASAVQLIPLPTFPQDPFTHGTP